VFLVGSTRIHLDRVQGLGDFLEIEVVLAEGQSHAEGHEVAESLMRALGVEPERLVAEAYIDLHRSREASV
jgi:adenylate cyclase class IV